MKAIITLVLCTMLISCNDHKSVAIVTTIKPIQMLVTAIAGEQLKSVQLIPDGVSPHHYALKPSDTKQLHSASLIFRIDDDFEIFLNKSLQQINQNTSVVSLANVEGVQLISLNKDHEDHEEHHVYSHSKDLHIWLDPNNAIAMSRIIAKKLAEIDPKHKQDYNDRMNQLITKIQVADEKLKIKLKPMSNKAFMVFHNGWGYFEKHYGLKNITVINQSPTDQLGVAKVKVIRNMIKRKKIECLFSEPQSKAAILQTLIKGSHAKASKLDILGSQIKINSDSYIELLDSIADGLLNC